MWVNELRLIELWCWVNSSVEWLPWYLSVTFLSHVVATSIMTLGVGVAY